MDEALEATFKGYTVLELTDFAKPSFELIPRRNVVSAKKQIVFEVNDEKGYPFDDLIGQTVVTIGKPKELGLMADLCGMLIWKRNALQLWAAYTEKFGQPLITATTSTSSDQEIKRLRGMLQEMGEAAQAILPAGCQIDVKELSTGDNYKVFDMQIERINTEISKAVLGGTMISDNGSSDTQAKVHERTLNDKIAARDRRIITFVVNDQIIPMLYNAGFDINPDTYRFEFEESYELSLMDLLKVLEWMYDRFDIPMEWIAKTFNIPIDGVKEFIKTNPVIPPGTPLPGQKGFWKNFR